MAGFPQVDGQGDQAEQGGDHQRGAQVGTKWQTHKKEAGTKLALSIKLLVLRVLRFCWLWAGEGYQLTKHLRGRSPLSPPESPRVCQWAPRGAAR